MKYLKFFESTESLPTDRNIDLINIYFTNN